MMRNVDNGLNKKKESIIKTEKLVIYFPIKNEQLYVAIGESLHKDNYGQQG